MRPTQILGVGKYRHLKLTTKDVGRGFYKGNRTGSMGRHTKYGGYIVEWNKVRTYVVPQNLSESKVRLPGLCCNSTRACKLERRRMSKRKNN
jgi:large subunit ribosomal protein L41